MATLNAAQTATVNITTPGGYITVDCSSGAVVQVSWVSPGGVSGQRRVLNISEDIGPFADSTAITLRCDSGSASYSETGSQIPALVSDAGNVPALLALLDGGGSGPVSTWANLPAASANAGKTYRVSDIGKPGAGSLWISDGTRWVPLNGQAQLLSCSLPIIMPSNGSVAANGALTLNVALDTTYAQGCYMYFAAGQVYSGSAAGFYYVVMSSTTAGTIYNNVLAATGWPTQPASPTAIVAAGPGGYTGDNGTDRTALSITLPGSALGITGRLRSRLTLQASTGSGTRFAKSILSAYAFHVIGLTSANTFACTHSEIINLGAVNRQRGTTYDASAGYNGNVAYTPTSSSTDTSVDTTLTVTLRNSAGTEWAMLTTADVTIGS